MQTYIVWATLFVVLCIVEANTANLMTIWFAAGALITLIAVALGVPPVWQVPIFIVSSLILLALTRPLVKKKLSVKGEKTNADRVVGKTAIVRESITHDKFSGTVTVAGQVWSAVTSDGSTIDEGEEVVVEAIEGVKLVVASKNKVEV
ncbi:MAG: NfeD family protein [Clostridia bacterium]|nr:NfeD family protein [Clostridia bacterium]